MRHITVIGLVLLSGCSEGVRLTPVQEFAAATNTLVAATNGLQRFHTLGRAAKLGFSLGHTEDADRFATELLASSKDFPNDWNFGNAIHDGHMVLGRVALKNGNIDEAKRRLIEAAGSPGSPTMNSFGPNVSLAKDLLAKGESDTVLEYFKLCRKFWKGDFGKLDLWTEQVNAGQVPDFGANLYY